MELTEGLLALLRQPSTCYVATTMPGGSPQLTQTWVDTDGEHVLINTAQGPEGPERRTRPSGGRVSG